MSHPLHKEPRFTKSDFGGIAGCLESDLGIPQNYHITILQEIIRNAEILFFPYVVVKKQSLKKKRPIKQKTACMYPSLHSLFVTVLQREQTTDKTVSTRSLPAVNKGGLADFVTRCVSGSLNWPLLWLLL